MFSRLVKLWKSIGKNPNRVPLQKRKTQLLMEQLEDRTVPSNTPFLQTNLPDYPPGGTVQVAGGNFAPGETVQFSVVNLTHPGDVYPAWQVADASDGSLQTTWTVPNNTDSYNATFQLTALGTTGDTATTSFTDAPTEFQRITMNNPSATVLVNQAVAFSGASGELADFQINSAYVPTPPEVLPSGPSSFTVTVKYGETFANPGGFTLPSSDVTVTYNPATLLGTVSVNLTYATAYFRDVNDANGQSLEVDITDNSSAQVDTATEGFQVFDTISGTKLQDNNGNGFANDSAYTGPAVTIDLYNGGTTTITYNNTNFAPGLLITSTTTGAGGNYSFTDIGPGTYTVSEVVPAGWTQTAPTPVPPGTWTVPIGTNNSPAGTPPPADSLPSTNNNFADFQGNTISGTKYLDPAGTGFTDETAYTGPAVTIDLSKNGTPDGSTTTDANGNYSFTNLGAGTYTVSEVVPTGWTETAQTGATILATGGQTYTGNNFADFQNFAISGTKTQDNTGGGFANDSAYTGPPVTIDLYDNGNLVGSTTTNANGNYSFTNLGPGTYTVSEIVPSGWTETAATGGSFFPGSAQTTPVLSTPPMGGPFQPIGPFATYGSDSEPGVIITIGAGGSVIAVSTGQGPYDGVEDTYIGVIDAANSGVALNSINLAASTDIFGFDGDGIQTYGAPAPTAAELPAGYTLSGYEGPGTYFTNINGAQTAGTVNFNDGTGHGLQPGQQAFFSLEEAIQTGGAITGISGQNSTGNNFANFQNINISGTKYLDPTGNGFANEAAYTGPTVTIDLYQNGSPDGSTTTNANGNYSFTNLGPGTYTVSEVVPSGWTETAQTGATIVATSGVNSTGNNFADFAGNSISGTKYLDPNGNGFANEAAYTGPAVTVDLYDNGNLVGSTTTDVNGNYSFTNLGAGTYTVSEVVPTGWTETAQTGATIAATGGVNSTGNNFADFQNITISGTKYLDPTGNGFANEAPYTGPTVTIDLYDNGTADGSTTTDANGNYSFTNLGPGTYTVSEVVPSGWTETAQTGATIVATSGLNSTGNNFADAPALATPTLTTCASFYSSCCYSYGGNSSCCYSSCCGASCGNSSSCYSSYCGASCGNSSSCYSSCCGASWGNSSSCYSSCCGASYGNSSSCYSSYCGSGCSSGSDVVGTAIPEDSAVLAGGNSPTGTITFTLYYNGSPVGSPIVDTVTGNGTYTAVSPGVATQAGVYTWTANYSGDTLNHSATDLGGPAEQLTVVKASPCLVTNASFYTANCGCGSNVVGTAILQDTAVLSCGYNETGNLIFTLYGPCSSTPVYCDTIAANGNGCYTVCDPCPAAAVGTYTWHVAFAGDSNNNCALDQGGCAEQLRTVKASPTLTTCASFESGTGNLVCHAVPEDSAVLCGGYNVCGTITFTLTGSHCNVVYTQTVCVNGDGTYCTSDTTPLTQSGTYTWSAVYSGNSFNNCAHDQGGCAERLTVVSSCLGAGYSYSQTCCSWTSCGNSTYSGG